jgi:alanine racemase
MKAAWTIIHLDNFRRNLSAVRERIGAGRHICVPVKADAYGHGALRIARAALENGASHLGVAALSEGAELREAGITAPILLFSRVLPGEIPDLLYYRLSPFVYEEDFIAELDRAAGGFAGKQGTGRKCAVHLKIDTGMGRLGCRSEDAPRLAALIGGCGNLQYAGTATHLAVSDSADEGDRAYTKKQLALFTGAVAAIRAGGINPGLVHAANSGALMLHEDAFFDMVRPGIFLYGYKPAGLRLPDAAFQAAPLMELRARIIFIRKVKKGESVSYGRAWTASEETFIGILSLGYAGGLPRLLSGKGWPVRIKGKSYPLVGRICMEHCMVNLGPKTGVELWDEVKIFGPPSPEDGDEKALDAGDLAGAAGTIPYEITCNINKRIPRVYM